MAQTASFTLGAAKKIVAAVESVNNQPVNNIGNRSLKRSYNERGFWSRLECYCTFAPNRWKYGWVEVVRDSNDEWVNKENGRTGDCCNGATTYALNAVEASNTASGIQGDSQSISSSLFVLPVQGSPIVWMRMDFPEVTPGNDRTPVYSFAYENATSSTAPGAGTCCPGSGTSSLSSSSGNYACVFAYVSIYNCITKVWGPPQKSGVNCMPIGALQFNTWVQANPNSTSAYWYIQGNPCPGPEQTHGCGNFPAEPTTLPTTTPNCGSSSSSGSGSSGGAFTCYFAFSATYNCQTKTWGPVIRDGVNCMPTGSVQTGVWTGTGQNAYYYISGATCNGPEQTVPCGAFPAAPSAGLTYTPNNCPSSGSSGASSGSSTSSTSTSSGSGSGGGGTGTYVTNVSISGCTLTVSFSDGSSSQSSIPCCCGSSSTGGGGGSSQSSQSSGSSGSSGSTGSASGSGSSLSGSVSSGSTSSGSSGSSTTPQYWVTLQEYSCAAGAWLSLENLGAAGSTVPINGNGQTMPVGSWGLFGTSTGNDGSLTCAYWYTQGPSTTQPPLPPARTDTPSDCACPSGSSHSSGSSGSGKKLEWQGPPVEVARPRFVPGITEANE